MRYFKPAIITLIIAVIAIFALLFYVSIVNEGDVEDKNTLPNKKFQTATISIPSETDPQNSQNSGQIGIVPENTVSPAPTEATTMGDISKDGVTYPESVLKNPITMIVTADDLRIRSKPDQDGEILGLLYTDTEITKYGATGNWSYIKYRDITGWVSSEYLRPEL